MSEAAADQAPEQCEWEWEEIYEEMAEPLISLARRRYGLNHQDAEDALQRTAEAIAFTHFNAPIRNRRGYFTGTFLHMAYRIFTERKRRNAVEIPMPEDDSAGQDDPRLRLDALIRMRRAITLLPPFCRQLIESTLLGNNVLESAKLLDWPQRRAYKRRDSCWRKLVNALS